MPPVTVGHGPHLCLRPTIPSIGLLRRSTSVTRCRRQRRALPQRRGLGSGAKGCRCGLLQHFRLPDGNVASARDAGVLRRPLKEELQPREVRDVFGYSRNFRKRYEAGSVLGAGSFGIVRRVTEISTGREFACKTVPKVPKKASHSKAKPAATPRYLLKLQTEVDAMMQLGASLDSVYLKDIFEDNESIHLVMELCEGGGILDRVKEGKFTEKRIARIIRSVLRFIAQCHAKGIIYRDVKPDNFLFLTTDDDSPVRATDFGLSIRHWPEDGKLRSRSGTPVYMAPEVIMQEYGEKCDEWSVGMLLYQLLTGVFPFWDSVQNVSLQQACLKGVLECWNVEVWQAILVKQIDLDSDHIRATIPSGARDLLKGLLKRDPNQRMSAVEALGNSWVREGGSASKLPLGGSVVQRLQRYATYGHLKQLVLRMIADDVMQLTDDWSDKLLALRELFKQLDEDSSGGISITELSNGLCRQGYEVSAPEVEQLMARLDLDDDGHVDFDEFAAGLLDWKELQQDKLWASWVDLAFSKLDSNGDGFIDLDELISNLPVDLENDSDTRNKLLLEARRMVREADTNGDGKVSREEFVELLQDTNVPDSLEHYDSRLSVAAS